MTVLRNLSKCKYEDLSKEFVIKQKNYQYQYAPLYAERLTRMKKDIEKAAINKWSSQDYEVTELADLEKNKKCIIIGTLYKEMKNKPNILKEMAEIEEDNALPLQPVLNRDAKYIDDQTDQLILEDELQRIILVDAPQSNAVSSGKLCTGIVIAVLGNENERSEFQVEDFCFKNINLYSKNLPVELNARKGSDNYVVFLSGIELGDSTKTNDYLYKLQLLFDYLRGDFLQDDVDENLVNQLSNTIRLVIAGNSLSSSTQSKDMINKAKYLTKNYIAGSVGSIKMLDEYLLQLIGHMEVDIMPGEYDPSNLMLPQQPLHHAMLVKSINSDFKYNLHTTTNPYRFSLNNVCFLGTSGQFIDDMRRSTSVDDPIELMRLTLEACHIGPTCPDTLASYPFYGKDPFILDNLPNVYFCGNQKEYKHGVYKLEDEANSLVQLISLPKFCETNSCVFLNLNTLKSEEIFF